MPFGLENAPATFPRNMTQQLDRNLREFALVYMDDIIVNGNLPKEHLARVFEHL